jgi:hypothetical protein
MKSHVLLTAVCFLSVVVLVGPAGAAERVLIPDDMYLPWYALSLGHSSDFTRVAVVFYRPFEDAPDDLLVNQWVFGLDPAEFPLSVEGVAVFQEEGDPVPLHSSFYNRPGETVEICFVSAEEYAPAMEGGVTIAELRAMPSLIVGYADFYLEIQNPADPDTPGEGFNRTVIASGVLEDDRPFRVHSTSTSGAYTHDYWLGD